MESAAAGLPSGTAPVARAGQAEGAPAQSAAAVPAEADAVPTPARAVADGGGVAPPVDAPAADP
eukprot:3803141-Alexandrium_andersonii.AAC.1